jgi:hypothetical protein
MKTLRTCALVLSMATSASAGPLRETLKWTALESAGQLGGDHLSSWYFDNHTMACFEHNPMLARSDYRYDVGKGWAFNAIGIGGLSTVLYLAKRTHHPRVELIAKLAMGVGAASGTYFGLHNVIGCAGKPMRWLSD